MKKYFSPDCSRSEVEQAQIAYGFQVLMYKILTMAVIFFIAALLGLAYETLCVCVGFGLFRLCAGGLHLNTRIGCLLTTGSIMIGGGALGRYVTFPTWSLVIIYAVVLTGVFLIAPQGTLNNPISPQDQKTMKKRSLALAAAYALIALTDLGGVGSWITIAAAAEMITVLILYIQKKMVTRSETSADAQKHDLSS